VIFTSVTFTLDGLGGYFDEKSSHATEVKITAFDKDGNEIDTQGGYRESGKYADEYSFTTNVPVDHFEITSTGSNGNYVVQNMTLSHTIVDDATFTAIAKDGTEMSLQSDINIEQGMNTTDVTSLVPVSDEPMTREVQVVDTEAMADKGAILVDGHWVVQTGSETVEPPMKDIDSNDTFERGKEFFNTSMPGAEHDERGHHGRGEDHDRPEHDMRGHHGRGEDHDRPEHDMRGHHGRDEDSNTHEHNSNQINTDDQSSQVNHIDGGEGFDTLVASDNNLNIDLSAIDDKVSNIEAINLNDGKNELSNIKLEDVISITDDDNILRIEGGENDTIELNTEGKDAEWSLGDFKTDAETGATYQEYIGGEGDDTVTLEISTEIHVDES
jgi:hypothetical protein